MRLSQLFVKTQKESPAGEESINAQLLQRAGFVYKEMAGVYTFLPLGLRVLTKIENIIRKHMDRVGTELLMTALAPQENREATGRLETVDVLMKTAGANEISRRKSTNEYILNCTHEDMITPIVKSYVNSYKDLPVTVYQIQNKFRNEARAKSGLLRGREFRMKDLYSFHPSQESFSAYYEEVKNVYIDIFEELGLGDDTYVTLASGGDFTERFSHEFQTLCVVGEDVIFLDTTTGIAYNQEIAPAKTPHTVTDEPLLPMEDVYGENIVSVERLVAFLDIPIEKTVKTLLYKDASGKIYAVAVRGDYEVNELKLKKVLGLTHIELISEEEILTHTGAQRGYTGIINLPEHITLVCDDSLEPLVNFESGTNKTHYHTTNINWERDIPRPEQFYDIKTAKQGDMHPETGTVYTVHTASEVGNIFPLESKFSHALDFQYVDTDNTKKPIIMGSYGIGSSGVMGVLVEKFHDDKGMVRPENVAPFTHCIIGIGEKGLARAAEVYAILKDAGMDVCFDDRDVGPGFKFKDAELIGYPWQIVIGDKTLEQGDMCELIDRKTGEKKMMTITDLLAR